MTDPSCLFCKIIAGTIPASIVHSDDNAIVILDIAPFEHGHLLVIPRHHATTLPELPEADALHVMRLIRHFGAHLMKTLPCDGFNVLQNNGACASQTIPHVHFHLVPRHNGKPLQWIPSSYASPEEMRDIHNRLKSNTLFT